MPATSRGRIRIRIRTRTRSPSRAREGGGGTVAVSFVSDFAETTDAGGTRYAPSRMSMAVSAADSQPDSEWQGQGQGPGRRRGSLYGAESTVGEVSEYGDAEEDDDEPIAARERTAVKKGKRATHPGEKEKGCIVQ